MLKGMINAVYACMICANFVSLSIWNAFNACYEGEERFLTHQTLPGLLTVGSTPELVVLLGMGV